MPTPNNPSRKRPAPGSSPINQQLQMPPSMDYGPSTDHMLWAISNGLSTLPDPSGTFDPAIYNNMSSPATLPETSTQLARRPANQQMVTQGAYNGGVNELWSGTMEDRSQQPKEEWTNSDDAALARKAHMAKKEAISKRKSIPPFVQKLSRYVSLVIFRTTLCSN
jgi:heat shock transcription factor